MIPHNQEDGSGKPLADAGRPNIKVGDVVRILPIVAEVCAMDDQPGPGVVSEMVEMVGKEYPVEDIITNRYGRTYMVNEWEFRPEWIEAVSRPEAKPADQREAETSSSPAPGEGAETKSDRQFAKRWNADILFGGWESVKKNRHIVPEVNPGDYVRNLYRLAKIYEKRLAIVPDAPAPVEDGKRGALPAALQAGADFIGDAVALAQFAKDHPEVNAQDCVGVWLGTDAVAHLHAIASLESMRKALEAAFMALGRNYGNCRELPTEHGLYPRYNGFVHEETRKAWEAARAALAEAGEGGRG